MKKVYRLHVPAIIALDVAAENDEQAKRIAAALAYTPCEPFCTWSDLQMPEWINLTVWGTDTLSTTGIEIVEEDPDTQYTRKVKEAMQRMAFLTGNTKELNQALHPQSTNHPPTIENQNP